MNGEEVNALPVTAIDQWNPLPPTLFGPCSSLIGFHQRFQAGATSSEHRGIAPLHFFRRHFFNFVPEHPFVAERVPNQA